MWIRLLLVGVLALANGLFAEEVVVEQKTETETEIEEGIESAEEIALRLGDIHYAVREAAQAELTKRGKAIIPALIKIKKENKDSEILLRVGELLYRFQRFGISGSLGGAEQKILKEPIQTKLVSKGKSAEFRNYQMGEYQILDIGKVRLACVSPTVSGSQSSGAVAIKNIKAIPSRRYGNSSSSYSFQQEKGRVKGRLLNLDFHLKDGNIVAQDHTISIEVPTIIFAAKDGTVMRVIPLKEKKIEAK